MIHTKIPHLVASSTAEPTAIARTLATHLGQPGLAVRAAATGSGLTRTLAAQVVNRQERECEGVFLISLVVSAAVGGAPFGVQVLGTPTDGAEIAQVVSDQAAIYLTDARGRLTLDVTQTGSWIARVFHLSVLGVVQGVAAA